MKRRFDADDQKILRIRPSMRRHIRECISQNRVPGAQSAFLMSSLLHQTVSYCDNPFSFGSVARGESFAGREKEIAELAISIRSRRSAVIHSDRKMEKTSILAELANRYSKDFVFVFVDLRGISDENQFIAKFARKTLETSYVEVKEFVPAIWNLISSARLRLAVLKGGELGITSGVVSGGLMLVPLRRLGSAGDGLRVPMEIAMCGKCGKPLKWIERYERHYCYQCKKYVPKRHKDGNETVARIQDSPPRICPVCGGEMNHIEKFDEYYCEACKKYPLIELTMRRYQKADHEDLVQALDLPEKIATQKRRKFVVILDEFQEMLAFDSGHLLEVMRERFGEHSNVTYIFSGSSWKLMRGVFEQREGAFFRFAHAIDLRGLPEEELEDFLISRYRSGGGKLSKDVAARLVSATAAHPHYSQQIAHELFHISRNPTTDDLEKAVRASLERHGHMFSYMWESIRSPLHRKYLLAIAAEPNVSHGMDFIRRHGLRSRSHVQRIETQLEARGVVNDGEIADPLFLLWLRAGPSR